MLLIYMLTDTNIPIQRKFVLTHGLMVLMPYNVGLLSNTVTEASRWHVNYHDLRIYHLTCVRGSLALDQLTISRPALSVDLLLYRLYMA